MKIRIKFNKKAIDELAELEKKTTHPKLLLRINVLQMVACGIPNKVIQEIKKISHDSLRRFRKLYRKSWIEWLLEWGCEWRCGKLDELQKKKIQEIGEAQWFKTANEAQKLIKDNFWIDYKIRQVQKLLKKRNLLTKKQPGSLENAQV